MSGEAFTPEQRAWLGELLKTALAPIAAEIDAINQCQRLFTEQVVYTANGEEITDDQRKMLEQYGLINKPASPSPQPSAAPPPRDTPLKLDHSLKDGMGRILSGRIELPDSAGTLRVMLDDPTGFPRISIERRDGRIAYYTLERVV